MTSTAINGIHHVSAIAGSAQRNLDFWAATLGFRFLKKTVNFDDPSSYHLYYGDEVGRAGSLMTFFPWSRLAPGRAGAGEANLVMLSVPKASLGFWQKRIPSGGGKVLGRESRFGEQRLRAQDPDGLPFALIGRDDDQRVPWTTFEIERGAAIRGLHGVGLTVADLSATAAVLTGVMNFTEDDTEGNTTRFSAKGRIEARHLDITVDDACPAAQLGPGSIHHVAFSVANHSQLLKAKAALAEAGLRPTEPIDRNYFESVYFRSPGGVLFEIATEEPGFTVDETAARLGERLKLPAQHEHLRLAIERTLPPLRLPRQ